MVCEYKPLLYFLPPNWDEPKRAPLVLKKLLSPIGAEKLLRYMYNINFRDVCSGTVLIRIYLIACSKISINQQLSLAGQLAPSCTNRLLQSWYGGSQQLDPIKALKTDCHNLLQSPGVINLESCQLQIPQVISCCILSPLSHRYMIKPSSHQLHVCVMAAGSSIRPQVINCMCGCWFRLSPQVINCMMYVSWLLDPASITIA